MLKTPTTEKKEKPPNTSMFEDGKKVRCIKSASPGYKVNHLYKVYKNDKNILCLKGEDGFEDMCSMLVSSFKKVE